MDQAAKAILRGPIAPWREADPRRPGIERAKIEVHPVLVGLATVEGGAFELDLPDLHSRRDHAVADVGGILQMMSQRRGWDLGRGSAMHECHRPERRLARRT